MKKALCSLAAPLVVLLAVSGCAHRPRYLDVVKAAGASAALEEADLPEGKTVPLRVVDPKTQAPLAGAGIHFGEGKRRVLLRTDREGRVQLPLSKQLAKDNPIVEVLRATGGGYLLQQDGAPAASAQPADPSVSPDAADAGAPPTEVGSSSGGLGEAGGADAGS